MRQTDHGLLNVTAPEFIWPIEKAIEPSGKLAGEAPQVVHPNEIYIALGLRIILCDE